MKRSSFDWSIPAPGFTTTCVRQDCAATTGSWPMPGERFHGFRALIAVAVVVTAGACGRLGYDPTPTVDAGGGRGGSGLTSGTGGSGGTGTGGATGGGAGATGGGGATGGSIGGRGGASGAGGSAGTGGGGAAGTGGQGAAGAGGGAPISCSTMA